MGKSSYRFAALLLSVFLGSVCTLSATESVHAQTDKGNTIEISGYSEAGQESLKEEDFLSGRLIVESLLPMEDEHALSIEQIYDGFYIIQYENAEAAMEAYEILQNMWWIRSLQPDGIVELEDEELTEEEEDGQWPSRQIGLDLFQEFILRHYSKLPVVKVAVLDTGVDSDLECMEGRLLNGAKNFCSSVSGRYPEDDHGHGTMVTNIIVSHTFSNVQILPIKVMNSSGEGYDSQIVNGIIYAMEYGVDMINLSIGGDGDKSVYKSLMEKASNNGIAVLVAAGNDGKDVNSCTPANIKSSITISAVNKNDEFSSTFSNYGQQIDFAAPGEEILTTGIGGQKYLSSGTSFATPYATAAFANIKSVDYEKSATDIYEMIKETAVDLGTEGWDEKYGYGRIDLSDLAVQYEMNFVLTGDINQDEEVNAVDAYLILQYIIGRQEFSRLQIQMADVNGDGTVSVMDVLYILQQEVSNKNL